MQEIKLVIRLDDVAGATPEDNDYTLCKLFLHYMGFEEEIYAIYMEAGVTEDDFFKHLSERAREMFRRPTHLTERID